MGAALTAHAQESSGGERYWGGRSDGWHFYEVEPPKPKKIKPPEPIAPFIAPAPIEPEPAPLSVEWLAKNIPIYTRRAIDNPTPENVELVAYLNRLSLDKSERYSQAMAQVAIRNPGLDEYARSPITSAQRATAEKAITAAKKQVMEGLSQRVGLWYFYSSTCPYCQAQDPILDYFQQRSAFSILNISLDGGPLASGQPKPFVVNAGHAEQLGVMTTPTLVVADTQTGQLYNLAAGLRTVSEIEERVLQLAVAENWITANQYDEAVRGEPRKFIQDGLDLRQLEDDPAALLAALKDASINSGGSTPWVISPNSTGDAAGSQRLTQ